MHCKPHAFLWVLLVLLLQTIWINGMQQLNIRFSVKNTEKNKILEDTMRIIGQELRCFPIPIAYQSRLYYIDSYGAGRENGMHEGCDIMDKDNKPGEIPIVSATDGVITNVGWLYLGGYRVGITSTNGIYYYYAHLDSYAAGINTGKQIKAGELLGFMGNTGEGEEGTSGKFDTHLHFGIYFKDEAGNEKSVNPYPFLLEIGGE